MIDAASYIKKHEGLRLRVYTDPRGYRTIGYGRNLDGKGISAIEALMLFTEDYKEALNEALSYPWFKDLNEPRQAAIIDMLFNLGAAGFRQFVRLHNALGMQDYHAAAAAMLNSAWAGELRMRAHEDAQLMDTGRWPD